MTPPHQADLPSSPQLLRATLASLVVASIVLVTIVLPAEYGLDPTGAGQAIGVFRPPAGVTAASDPLPETAAASSGSLLKRPAPFRNDEMTLTLKSGEGAEIKAAMRAGERFMFSWTTTGGVDVDMHGELLNAAEGNYTSYWKDELQSSGHGAFEAPAAGNYGWFWQNLNDDPVTVTVKTSGFYERLFRP